jgi:hypothetical protein
MQRVQAFEGVKVDFMIHELRASDRSWMCQAHEVSERRACLALGLDRSTIRYRGPNDTAVRRRIRELAFEPRRRFG